MFSFADFFTARATLCVIRYDHLAIKLGPDVQEWKFNHRLWTSISDARICKRCSVNQTSFHIPTVYSHFSLIFPRFLACGLQCALRRIQSFIQCGGESATDLRAARYRSRANWIGPEPDSVLRSVRSLIKTIHNVPAAAAQLPMFESRLRLIDDSDCMLESRLARAAVQVWLACHGCLQW